MDFNTLITYYVVFVVAYILILFSVMKKDRSLKRDLISSYIFFAIILVLNLLYIIEEKGEILEKVISVIMFLVTFNLIIVYRNRRTSSNNLLRTTYLKGKKIKYVLSSLLLIIVLTILINNNGFKDYIFMTILTIISLFVSITWNVFYFADQKKKNISNEGVIIYNDRSYVKYDVTNKALINLKKLIRENVSVVKERSFITYLTKDKINSLIWIFYVEDLNLEEDDSFDNKLYQLFKNIEGIYVEINMDENSVNVLR